jgi:hypothetical protein
MTWLDLEIPNPCGLWLLNHSVKDLYVVEAVAQITSRLQPGSIRKWALEAARWVAGCNDLQIGYRSLIILRALGGRIIPSLLVNAAAFHFGKINNNRVQEFADFIGECFTMLEAQMEDPEISPLAFKFASAFLNCPSLRTSAMEKAMPIFMKCAADETHEKEAKALLVEAFVPFATVIESSQAAQQHLLRIVEVIDAPALLILVAAFLLNSLPFLPINLTYKEIMDRPLAVDQLNQSISLLTVVLDHASRPLVTSILTVVTELISKYEQDINRASLVPIYAFVLTKIALFPSAVKFVQTVAKMDASIAVQRGSVTQGQKSIEDVQKLVMDMVIRKDPVTLTTCKNLQDLQGIIDQRNPPKIYPYAGHYEMLFALKKDNDSQLTDMHATGPRTFTSKLAMRSGMLSNKSFVLINTVGKSGTIRLDLHPLQVKRILKESLAFPDLQPEGVGQRFVVTPQVFGELEDVGL